ncbi:hypothetical protein VN97_g7670 [Penicillium thymicola]|uniref:Uncharacterized protein n=1 Tax=Penicillium thymicola TaxID=293382 RepID=A0AAI9TF61_PENTH|nr:hypothetical protein VN97_g7670 [Penicillium thymicola]
MINLPANTVSAPSTTHGNFPEHKTFKVILRGGAVDPHRERRSNVNQSYRELNMYSLNGMQCKKKQKEMSEYPVSHVSNAE